MPAIFPKLQQSVRNYLVPGAQRHAGFIGLPHVNAGHPTGHAGKHVAPRSHAPTRHHPMHK